MLNKLKEVKVPINIYTPMETQLKEASKEAFISASSKETFWEPS